MKRVKENECGQTQASTLSPDPRKKRAKLRLPRQLKFIFNVDGPLDIAINRGTLQRE
jgi:hypothetical protein